MKAPLLRISPGRASAGPARLPVGSIPLPVKGSIPLLIRACGKRRQPSPARMTTIGRLARPPERADKRARYGR